MIALIGTGPAALMAADRITAAGLPVTLFEKRKSPGRKLLVAGSSGLNISNSLPLKEFIAHYTRGGARPGEAAFWERVIGGFPPAAWVRFIEDLGFKTFEGTSGRYFIEEMKASRFLQAWVARLTARGATFVYDHECVGFESAGATAGVTVWFNSGTQKVRHTFSAPFSEVGFCLGGGSWEPQEVPLRWPEIFRERGVKFTEFTPSNVGYAVAWPEKFLQEADGKPLKRIVMTTARGAREGDAMITRYGIEGTPVYFTGMTGEARLNLRPDFSAAQIAAKLRGVKENLSPIRRIAKTLNLCEAAFALVFHLSPRAWLDDRNWDAWGERLRAFPLQLGAPQPLAEAISSRGGVSLDAVGPDFQLRAHPGVYCAGEMLDWDAPTGGFLLQACVAQGAALGDALVARASAQSRADQPPSTAD